MSIKVCKYFLVSTLLLLLFCTTASAQLKLVNSPYSRAGIGTMHPTQFGIQRSMGNLSAALNDPLSINYGNPASYASLKLTTLEVGLQGNGLWLNNTTLQQSTGSGSFNYIALAFPVAKWWGSSIGLMPYASLHYDIKAQRYSPFADTLFTEHRFIGQGTTYQVYWGNGFKYKNIAFGANVAYLFGTQDRLSRSYFPEIPNSYGNEKDEALLVHGFAWNAGIQYDLKLKDDYHLILGAAGNANTNVNASKDGKWTRVFVNNDQTAFLDSVYVYEKTDGKITLPTKANLGISLKKENKWLVGIEGGTQQWGNFKNFGTPDSTLTNSTYLSMGFEVTPDYRAITKFWQSTRYRGGFRYSTGNIIIGDTNLPEWAASFGLGLPIRKVNSRINIGLEVGQRGTLKNNLIRETFVTATFGFTLNDRWFIKPKYD